MNIHQQIEVALLELDERARRDTAREIITNMYALLARLQRADFFRWDKPGESLRGIYTGSVVPDYAHIRTRDGRHAIFSTLSKSLREQLQGIPDGADLTITYKGPVTVGSRTEKAFTVEIHTSLFDMLNLVGSKRGAR